MKILRQFLVILAFTFAGEVLHGLLPLPVPAAVYGLALLFAALQSGLLPAAGLEEAGQFLLKIMPVLFVAPAAALTDSWPLLAGSWAAVVAIVAVSTLGVFGVSGAVTQTFLNRRARTAPKLEKRKKEVPHG